MEVILDRIVHKWIWASIKLRLGFKKRLGLRVKSVVAGLVVEVVAVPCSVVQAWVTRRCAGILPIGILEATALGRVILEAAALTEVILRISVVHAAAIGAVSRKVVLARPSIESLAANALVVEWCSIHGGLVIKRPSVWRLLFKCLFFAREFFRWRFFRGRFVEWLFFRGRFVEWLFSRGRFLKRLFFKGLFFTECIPFQSRVFAERRLLVEWGPVMGRRSLICRKFFFSLAFFIEWRLFVQWRLALVVPGKGALFSRKLFSRSLFVWSSLFIKGCFSSKRFTSGRIFVELAFLRWKVFHRWFFGYAVLD